MIIFIMICLIIFGLLGFINGLNLLNLISFFSEVNTNLYWIVYTIFFIILLVMTFSSNKQIKKIAGWLIGFSVYYFIFNILFMIIPTRSSEKIEILKIAGSTIISIIGFIRAHRIVITTYNIEVNKFISNLNIVMCADLHLGILIDHTDLSKIVREINKLKPDLLLIPGDFFDGNMNSGKELEKISLELKKINTKYGSFVSPGNHDLYIQKEELREFLKNSNLLLLDDKIMNIENITIIGRNDKRPIDTFKIKNKRASINDLMTNINNNDLLILLDHQPTDLKNAAENNIDLTLSGHTHKGQFSPGNIITYLININHYGYKMIENTHTIVTSGVGYWMIPLRICSKSEIINIKINEKM